MRLRASVVLAASVVALITAMGACESRRCTEAEADGLVQQLRGLPTPLPGGAKLPPEEEKRRDIYEQLHTMERCSVPSLARALQDPDVNMRRNATLALGALGGGWWQFASWPSKIDTEAALPALVTALQDSDEDVRAWAAQAIGDIGPHAMTAVPALLKLLSEDSYSRISVFIALHGIGPSAKAALPALNPYLTDSDADVRKMAAWAVEAIQ